MSMRDVPKPDKGWDALDDKDKKAFPMGLAGAGLVAVLSIVFILQNTDDTEVKFLWIEFTAGLWFVILVSMIAGVLFWAAIGFLRRRSRRKERRD